VEVTKGHSHLSGEKSNVFFRESFDLDEVAEKLTALDEFHEEVDTIFVLEDVFHVHEEWVVDCVKDVFLKPYIVELFMFDDHVFTDTLHSIEITVVFVLDKEDLAESALSDHLFDFEVFELGLFLVSTHVLHVCRTCHRLSHLIVFSSESIILTRVVVFFVKLCLHALHGSVLLVLVEVLFLLGLVSIHIFDDRRDLTNNRGILYDVKHIFRDNAIFICRVL